VSFFRKKESVATMDTNALPVFQVKTSDTISEWYQSQTFIGWQQCATMAQHWLVSAACEIPVTDAVRRGWRVDTNTGDTLDVEVVRKLNKENKRINIKEKIRDFGVFGRVYGYRVAIFLIDGYGAKDYLAPFNEDGVKQGSYRGILTPDPYFITPINLSNDPSSLDFYEPEYWMVSGVKYHKSHCIMFRHCDTLGQQLKPMYMYGSVPLPQQIYEQVYQAMNAVSEGNKLLMTKRLWVQNGDIAAMVADQYEAEQRLLFITQQRDNHGVQLIDTDDSVSQMETALNGVMEVIDQQLQIVAAIARIPVNKLMQNQLQGFAATGEGEESVYNETLETLQEKLVPLIERHTLYSMLNTGVTPFDFDIKFNNLKALTDKEIAEANKLKADTDMLYMTMGVIDSQEARNRLIIDEDSGYSGLSSIIEDDNEYEKE